MPARPLPRLVHRRPRAPRRPRCHPARESWRLTTAEKKRILTEHIFGVDIDRQAVEVSKLSLLLKVLENETDQTLARQLTLLEGDAKARVLPNLDQNIKCGNSLIGPDYFAGQLLADPEEMRRVNAFDWQHEFPEAMRAGGFDAVIGNPPYGADLSASNKVYLAKYYPFVSDYETSQYFLAKADGLTSVGGCMGFIVPNTLFLNKYAQNFRNFLCSEFTILKLANLAEVDVFTGATVRTAIPIVVKAPPDPAAETEFWLFDSPTSNTLVCLLSQAALAATDNLWVTSFADPRANSIREKIRTASIPLSEIVNVSQGLIPYDKYRGHDEYTIKNRIWHADRRKDKTYKRELRGGDVTRYCVTWNGHQWISYGPWLAAPRKREFFTQPRLLFREITDPKSGLLHAAYTESEYYNNPGIINCILKGPGLSLLYLLAIANSRLTAYLHFASSPKARKGIFPKILVDDVRKIRVYQLDLSNKTDRQRHEKIVSLVTQMLDLHQRLPTASPADQQIYQRQIGATDREIDRLVYELYDLTPQEIALVEAAAAPVA